ncbi:hypothetical protein C8A01DRAFT_14184 [Parachaetomium inaequale]|uniref:Uncharacterized protein n=1 Tax=Parachaetomium inaequale TaxID=2588326 RepID=A0AAN6SU32_9PEZI|nr:hypothetical protein C8A01DRAFT_14184 [Parachaetomium inaequale]
MEVCYCANYYILKSGTSLTPGRLPDDCLWLASQSRSHEERDDHSERSSFSTSRRPSWPFRGLSLASSSKKPTSDAGIWWNGKTSFRTG